MGLEGIRNWRISFLNLLDFFGGQILTLSVLTRSGPFGDPFLFPTKDAASPRGGLRQLSGPYGKSKAGRQRFFGGALFFSFWKTCDGRCGLVLGLVLPSNLEKFAGLFMISLGVFIFFKCLLGC